jgi:hypothetical protein
MAIPPAATVGEAVIAEATVEATVEVTKMFALEKSDRHFDPSQSRFLRFIPV